MSSSPSRESLNHTDFSLESLPPEHDWVVIGPEDIPAQELVDYFIPVKQTKARPKIKPRFTPSDQQRHRSRMEVILCVVVIIIILVISAVIAAGIYILHTFA